MGKGKGYVSAKDLLGGERDMFEITKSYVMDMALYPHKGRPEDMT